MYSLRCASAASRSRTWPTCRGRVPQRADRPAAPCSGAWPARCGAAGRLPSCLHSLWHSRLASVLMALLQAQPPAWQRARAPARAATIQPQRPANRAAMASRPAGQRARCRLKTRCAAVLRSYRVSRELAILTRAAPESQCAGACPAAGLLCGGLPGRAAPRGRGLRRRRRPRRLGPRCTLGQAARLRAARRCPQARPPQRSQQPVSGRPALCCMHSSRQPLALCRKLPPRFISASLPVPSNAYNSGSCAPRHSTRV